jgi:hypothetical protein
MPRNGGVSFIRIWSPSPETGDWRGIPVSVSEAARYDSVLRALKDASAFSSASGVMMNDDMNQVLDYGNLSKLQKRDACQSEKQDLELARSLCDSGSITNMRLEPRGIG